MPTFENFRTDNSAVLALFNQLLRNQQQQENNTVRQVGNIGQNLTRFGLQARGQEFGAQEGQKERLARADLAQTLEGGRGERARLGDVAAMARTQASIGGRADIAGGKADAGRDALIRKLQQKIGEEQNKIINGDSPPNSPLLATLQQQLQGLVGGGIPQVAPPPRTPAEESKILKGNLGAAAQSFVRRDETRAGQSPTFTPELQAQLDKLDGTLRFLDTLEDAPEVRAKRTQFQKQREGLVVKGTKESQKVGRRKSRRAVSKVMATVGREADAIFSNDPAVDAKSPRGKLFRQTMVDILDGDRDPESLLEKARARAGEERFAPPRRLAEITGGAGGAEFRSPLAPTQKSEFPESAATAAGFILAPDKLGRLKGALRGRFQQSEAPPGPQQRPAPPAATDDELRAFIDIALQATNG